MPPPTAATGSLDTILTAATARRGPPVVVFATQSHHDVLWNWLRHARAAGATSEMVIALDAPLLDELLAAGVNAVGWRHDGSLADLWQQRLAIFSALCSAGIDFVHSDADAVWLRDPVAHCFEPDLDLVFSQGTVWPYAVAANWGFVLCCGFFAARSRPAVRAFLAETARRAVETNDQAAVNQLLCDAGVSWVIPAAPPPRMMAHFGREYRCYDSLLVGTCPALDLKIGLLPMHEFQRVPVDGVAYVKHPLTPKEPEAKRLRLRELGLWTDGPLEDPVPGRASAHS
jgi:hypothetical protein